MGYEFEKSEHTSLEKNNNEGNFKELARKKAFQRKRRTGKKYFIMPLAKKEPDGPKKEDFFLFFLKSLSKMNLCKEYVCNFCVLCTKYAWV